MATLQTIQASIDSKAAQFADNKLTSLALGYKKYLLDNIDPAAYASKEIYKGLMIPLIFDQGKAYDQLHIFYFKQEQARLTTLAISKL